MTRTIVGATDDTLQSFSGFFKADERSEIRIITVTKANNSWASDFDIGDGEIDSENANHNVILEKYTDGWYRILLSFDVESGGTTPSVGCYLGASGSFSYNGDSSSGLHLWGLQIEVDAAFPSSYIATAAATATRNADVLYLPFDFDTQPMSLFCKQIVVSTHTNHQSVIHIGANDGSDPQLALYHYYTGAVLQPAISYDDGVTSRAAAAAITIALGNCIEQLGWLHPDGDSQVTASQDGAAAVSSARTAANTFPGAFAADRLYLGQGTSVEVPTIIQELKVYRGVQTLEFMREL
jgi:hypothetical protein